MTTNDTVIEDDDKMDTGKIARECLRILRAMKAQQDTEKQERETRWAALKRGVMQIVKGWGWVE